MFDFFLAIIILLLTIAFYLYLNRNSDYWKIRKVPYIHPIPIFGNLKPLILLKRSPGQFTGDLYNAPEGAGQRFLGIFIFNNKPALLIRDPELVKSILVKDFQYFTSRNTECDEHCDPVGVNNIFVIRGPIWKFLRGQLGPTFTSAKMRQVFHLIKDTASELVKFIEKNAENCNGKFSTILEAKSILSRFTIDVISMYAFGLKSNAITNSKSHFWIFGDKIFNMTIKRSLEVRSFVFMHWMVKTFKFVFLQKESTQFFREVFRETLLEREKNKIFRNDLIDTLIRLKNEGTRTIPIGTENEKEEILEFKEDLLLAQPIFFFTAGFETTAATISLSLYELALHTDIQERLRKEILSYVDENGGELTFEIISEMKYLDMVVSETLRKYPPMPFLDRLCTMDYLIPDTDIIIKKGTPVFISLYKGLHYDENIYPMPDNFDPERFTDENKQTRHPFSYLPFGEGPHVCLARRFGLTNVKTALYYILKNFKVEICDQTEIPLEIDNRSIIVTGKNGNHLKFVKI